jgi:hypothetical protein
MTEDAKTESSDFPNRTWPWRVEDNDDAQALAERLRRPEPPYRMETGRRLYLSPRSADASAACKFNVRVLRMPQGDTGSHESIELEGWVPLECLMDDVGDEAQKRGWAEPDDDMAIGVSEVDGNLESAGVAVYLGEERESTAAYTRNIQAKSAGRFTEPAMVLFALGLVLPGLAASVPGYIHSRLLLSAIGAFVLGTALTAATMAASALLGERILADGTGNESGIIGAQFGIMGGYAMGLVACCTAGWILRT